MEYIQRNITIIIGIFLLFFATFPSYAETLKKTIIIQNHRFSPEILEVPQGKRMLLEVNNQDATPEEFESHSLGREKIIKGHSKALIRIGPLKPGTYEYFGEFHMDTAKGKIIAK